MAADQRGTVALVTGAAHGIGFEVCRRLAERGMTVILTARAPEKAEAAAEQLAGDGLDVRPRALDVSDDGSVRALAAELEREFGRLDVLVNNAAAYTDWSEIASTADLGAARAVLETNLLGRWPPWLRACAPGLYGASRPRDGLSSDVRDPSREPGRARSG